MPTSKSQPQLSHQHGPNCGHKAVQHGDHMDYLLDGHLQHQEKGKIEDHVIEVNDANPSTCQPTSCKGGHKQDGSEKIPHGDHFDYVVNGRLHHLHQGHCDDHGQVKIQ